MIGSITCGDMSLTESSIPAKYLSTLRISADEAPRSVDVLPVIIVPSGSSIAAAGLPVSSALMLAAATTGRSPIDIPAFSIRSLILFTAVSDPSPLRLSHIAL